MGRKAALTPEQLLAIEHRHYIGGESLNSIAKELGLNESTLRRNIKPKKAENKAGSPALIVLAQEKAQADTRSKQIAEKIAELPVSRQIIVNDLARRLANISDHVAASAEFSAATSRRLAGIANGLVEQIDDAEPLTGESLDVIRNVAVITKVANDAAHVPLNLLAANKELTKPKEDDSKEYRVVNLLDE